MPYQMPPWRGEATLRDKIINTLREVAEGVVNFVADPIKSGLHNLWDWVGHTLGEELVRYFPGQIDEIIADPNVPPDLKNFLGEIKAGHSPVHPVLLGMLISAVLMPIIGAATLGPVRRLQMLFMHWFLPARPSYRDLVMGYLQGRLADPLYREWLTDMGFGTDFVDMFPEWLRPTVMISMLADAYHRGALGPPDGEEAKAWLDSELQHYGYPAKQREWIKATLPNLPSVADMITMLAREAFEPDMIEHYGLGDEYPELFTQMMAKIGYDKEWALRHWYKHWDVPSLTQVYDMLHRGVLEEPDVWDFFRLVEISPFWRDKLIQIQYRLPTRVDIRRMYRDRHLTRDQVKALYIKLGYSPENAELLTELAVTFYKSADKTLTRTDIVTAYKSLGWGREEAAEMLAELGYDTREVEYYLDYADYQRVKEYVDTAEKLIKTQYVRGIIDQATASGRLAELGENAAQIATLVALWTLEREAKIEHPTVSQLSDFYERRIIAGPRLEAELAHLNYTPTYISWIHTAIDSRIAEENARKTEAQLRRDQASHKYPTRADLESWLEARIIDETTYRQRLLDLGYSPQDVTLLLEEERRKMAGRPAFPSRADLGRWFKAAIINERTYRARMGELGYSPEDIERYLEELTAE